MWSEIVTQHTHTHRKRNIFSVFITEKKCVCISIWLSRVPDIVPKKKISIPNKNDDDDDDYDGHDNNNGVVDHH